MELDIQHVHSSALQSGFFRLLQNKLLDRFGVADMLDQQFGMSKNTKQFTGIKARAFAPASYSKCSIRYGAFRGPVFSGEEIYGT